VVFLRPQYANSKHNLTDKADSSAVRKIVQPGGNGAGLSPREGMKFPVPMERWLYGDPEEIGDRTAPLRSRYKLRRRKGEGIAMEFSSATASAAVRL
jgi:hypothetical protein